METEKQEYALHQNHFEDAGYVRFLSQVLNQALVYVAQSNRHAIHALDFGCGPSPVLAALLYPHVKTVTYFDPLFYPNAVLDEQQFDLITCTEAIEHFHQPAREWERLTQRLSSQGVLIVMTKRVLGVERFANWHYKNDPTHVSFFSEQTFQFLAKRDQLAVSFPTADIAVFTRR